MRIETMQLEEEVAALKVRIERLEATVQRLMEGASPAADLRRRGLSDPAQLRAWLTVNGIASEPSPLEQEASERWRELPESEKQRVRAELDALSPGPMVSDIVIEQRR
jgi:hypothetical protein